ncbi:hypothetical protein ACTMU2_37210 [Cupriavidus basilensis]
MTRLKVMTVVGTRPKSSGSSRVIAKLDQHTEHELPGPYRTELRLRTQ